MGFAIVQTTLDIPPGDALKRAFRAITCLTDLDAPNLARDAFGVLVKGLSQEDVGRLQGALRIEGIETEIVPDHLIPAMPSGKQIHRLDFQADALLIYDPLGRPFPLEWRHIELLGAGLVTLIRFERERRELPTPGFEYPGLGITYGSSTSMQSDYSTREVTVECRLLEIIVQRAVIRYTAEADKFNFACLGERETGRESENFMHLIQEIAARAPNLVLNRGASRLKQGDSKGFLYPSKNAFHEELSWWLWQRRRPQD